MSPWQFPKLPASIVSKIHHSPDMHYGVLLLFYSMCWAVPSLAQTTNSLPVTTTSFEELAFYPTYSAPGTVVSNNDARISAEIDGIIIALPLRIGDPVKAGEQVAVLDCRDHVLAAEQADAMLEAARAENELARFRLDRARQLESSQSVSAEVLNEREAQAKQAGAGIKRLEAALDAARRQVEKCDIRAPFDAVIVERMVSRGELVGPATPLMRLLDVEQVEVHGTIQEQDLTGLQKARAVRFKTNHNSYPLRLRAVIPEVESRIRSYPVRLSFLDEPATPGQVGRIEWSSPQLHLPANLLVRRDGVLGIFIEEENHAVFHVLDSAIEGQSAAATLPPDTRIVIDGRFGLSHGDPITVNP